MSGLELRLPKDAAAREAALGLVIGKLRSLRPNFEYVVEIRQHRQRHSDEQRAYLFGVVYRTIADHCGYSTDDIHDHCKRMFLATGEDEHGIRRVKSIARMPTDELSQYIERVIAWAEVDLGLIIPPAIGGFRAA